MRNKLPAYSERSHFITNLNENTKIMSTLHCVSSCPASPCHIISIHLGAQARIPSSPGFNRPHRHVTVVLQIQLFVPSILLLLPASGARSTDLLAVKAECTHCPSIWPPSPQSSPFVCQTNSQAEPGESCTFSPALGFPLLHHTGLHHRLS